MSAPITVLRDTHPLPVLDACKWEKLEGDPHTVNLNAYTSEDGNKIMGTWICTPGKWYVEYVKWEYCDFREGGTSASVNSSEQDQTLTISQSGYSYDVKIPAVPITQQTPGFRAATTRHAYYPGLVTTRLSETVRGRAGRPA